MTTMVRFQVGDGEYAIPVDHVREVRSGERLSALPSSRDGVVGLLRDGGDALAVLDALGPGRDHVLLLQHGDRRFGLAVAAVTSVVDLAAAPGPPPDGQVGHLLSGVIEVDDGLVLLVDVGALLEILDTAAPPAGPRCRGSRATRPRRRAGRGRRRPRSPPTGGGRPGRPAVVRAQRRGPPPR